MAVGRSSSISWHWVTIRSHICQGPALWTDNERWSGLSDNAARLGVDIVRLGPFMPTLDQGTAAADVGLGSGATALVAFNDLLAIGILQRLRRRSVDVPGAISVVGHDDIFGADFCQPSLTTVRTDAERAGRTLVDLVLGRVVSRPDTPIVIPAQLVVRESTGTGVGRVMTSIAAKHRSNGFPDFQQHARAKRQLPGCSARPV